MDDKLSNESLDSSIDYLNKEIEKTIRDVPEQYQWGYKRFKTQELIDNNQKKLIDYYN